MSVFDDKVEVRTVLKKRKFLYTDLKGLDYWDGGTRHLGAFVFDFGRFRYSVSPPSFKEAKDVLYNKLKEKGVKISIKALRVFKIDSDE